MEVVCCKNKICTEENCNCTPNCHCGCKTKFLPLKYSQFLWREPKKAIAISLLLNILYFIIWINKMNLVTLLCYSLMIYIVYKAFIQKENYIEIKDLSQKEQNIKELTDRLEGYKTSIMDYLKKIYTFENTAESLKFLAGIYFLKIIFGCFSNYFIFLIVLNLCLFAAIIKNHYPAIFRYVILPVIELFQGISAIIQALVPRYDDKGKSEEKKNN